MIYLDNAATTKMDKEALSEFVLLSEQFYGNPSQPYKSGILTRHKMEEARSIIANCINAKPKEIFFTSGGTESDNWAIKNTNLESLNKGVLISSIEHHAVINSCLDLDEEITYVNVDSKGTVEIKDYNKKIKDKRLASIMLVNNELGTIQPIIDLAKIAHENDVYFHTDAVQAVGHMDVDVKELGIDLLSASAHKFNGPKGVGFLYIKEGTPISSFQSGGGQENNLRAGTENVPGIYSMAIALKNNCLNLKKNITKIKELENMLICGINNLNCDCIINSSNNKIPGIVNVSFYNMEGESILHRLDLQGICISTGSACDSKNIQVSHVIKAIKLKRKYALGTIRISIGKNNTKSDIQALLGELKNIVKD